MGSLLFFYTVGQYQVNSGQIHQKFIFKPETSHLRFIRNAPWIVWADPFGPKEPNSYPKSRPRPNRHASTLARCARAVVRARTPHACAVGDLDTNFRLGWRVAKGTDE